MNLNRNLNQNRNPYPRSFVLSLHHLFISLLLCFSVSLILWSPPLFSFQLTSLQPGLEYGHGYEITLSSEIYALRVDLKKFSLKPVDAREFKKKSMSVSEMAKLSGALAVINANFFDPSDRPLGLVLKEGKILNGFHPTKWYAAFLIRNSKALISKAFEKNQIQSFENGIQAGPRLVTQGRVPKLKNESSPKSLVGIDDQGLVWLIATGPVEISQLARWLAKSASDGGLGLPHALNLDGGSSTQLYLKAGKQEVSIPGLSWVPVGLGVFPRRN